MDAAATPAENASQAKPTPAVYAPKTAHSNLDASRRHSLPPHFLPPSLWSTNASTASLVETDQSAQGEHSLDEGSVANRILALRQLNGATRSRHRYAKSTGARNSTYNQPVIVRTYSGPARPRAQKRDLVLVKKANGHSNATKKKMDLKLPPVEAFSFKGIMDEIRSDVSEDLERIAEICARSKYSLSNQYEVHMPPQGRNLVAANSGGPTLQAIASDEEQTRPAARSSRAGRRTKSVAYGTLETIMSSSRSSDEDKSRKKPAVVLAEEVRGRAKAQLEMLSSNTESGDSDSPAKPAQRPVRHARSKSATFASILIDNAQILKQDTVASLMSPTSLLSEPARPQTSTTAPRVVPVPEEVPHSSASETRSSIFETISSWLSWPRIAGPASRQRRDSHAEGSLRGLLKATELNGRGRANDQAG